MATRKLIIGVDVGGTNTDAVLLDGTKSGSDAVLGTYKATTGTDVTTGIEEAIRTLLNDAHVPPSDIASLMIGTTHFINAVVERDSSRLDAVAVLRLAAGSYLTHTPPYIDFPSDLRKIMDGHSAKISGGVQIDGTEIGPVIEREVLEQAQIIKDRGLRSVAIVGIYSPLDEKYSQEHQVRSLLRKALGNGVNIICSREISGVGILSRENATILNASILHFARRTIQGFKRAMKSLDLKCPLYFTSNSGQLLSTKEAMAYPIQIFCSGATNSIRGAAFLSSVHQFHKSRYVIDIGGTTTDIGCLLPSGFPRLAGSTTEIGGVKVNFAMPQVESIGLGGGSLIHELEDGKISIGPESVGRALSEKAKCFGGDTLTTTDIMIAAKEATVGNTIPDVSDTIISAAKTKMQRMIEDHVDRMKTSAEPCDLLLVGGGAFLCPAALEGVASIEVPAHSSVANAVGAAVAEIGQSGEVIVDSSDKENALQELTANVISQAVSRGAKADQIRIIEEDVSGLAYMEGKFKITVKVSGPVDFERFVDDEQELEDNDADPTEGYHERKQWNGNGQDESLNDIEVDHSTYQPNIDDDRIWHLSEIDAQYIATGCYILGCAGGGTPYGLYLQTRQVLRDGGDIRIIDIDDLPDDASCCPVAGVGSPVLAIERLGGDMVLQAMQGLEEFLRIKFTATLTAEIGGSNGLTPLLLASSKYYNILCVDADLMGKYSLLGIHTPSTTTWLTINDVGRAFPAFEMSSLYIGADHVNDLLPACIASGEGTNLLLTSAKNTSSVDKILRAATVTMGLGSGIAARPAGKSELQKYGVPKSMSLSWRLGRAVHSARSRSAMNTVHEDLIREFGGSQSARKVFEGKITGIEQSLIGGRSHGTLVIERLKDYESEIASTTNEDLPEKVRIPFLNENLVLEATYVSGEKKILATVPDLIMVLDTLTGEACGVPEYRYGLKVFVMVAAAHPLWTNSERALGIAGPKAFGYDIPFQPCGTYAGVMSVIDEFGPPKRAGIKS